MAGKYLLSYRSCVELHSFVYQIMGIWKNAKGLKSYDAVKCSLLPSEGVVGSRLLVDMLGYYYFERGGYLETFVKENADGLDAFLLCYELFDKKDFPSDGDYMYENDGGRYGLHKWWEVIPKYYDDRLLGSGHLLNLLECEGERGKAIVFSVVVDYAWFFLHHFGIDNGLLADGYVISGEDRLEEGDHYRVYRGIRIRRGPKVLEFTYIQRVVFMFLEWIEEEFGVEHEVRYKNREGQTLTDVLYYVEEFWKHYKVRGLDLFETLVELYCLGGNDARVGRREVKGRRLLESFVKGNWYGLVKSCERGYLRGRFNSYDELLCMMRESLEGKTGLSVRQNRLDFMRCMEAYVSYVIMQCERV